MSQRRNDVIAVFNTSEDPEMLRPALERAGYEVVTAFTHALRDVETDLEALMRHHQPAGVVYDIALPYEQNWRFFERIRSAPVCEEVPFVLTTTNAAQVANIVGRDHQILEIAGKPYDLGLLVERMKDALRRKS